MNIFGYAFMIVGTLFINLLSDIWVREKFPKEAEGWDTVAGIVLVGAAIGIVVEYVLRFRSED